MTDAEVARRRKLERLVSLGEEIGRLEVRLQLQKDEAAEIMYHLQQDPK